MFALLQKMCTKKITVGSFAVRCIDEVKAKNVLPFGQQNRYFQSTKQSEKFYPL